MSGGDRRSDADARYQRLRFGCGLAILADPNSYEIKTSTKILIKASTNVKPSGLPESTCFRHLEWLLSEGLATKLAPGKYRMERELLFALTLAELAARQAEGIWN